MNELTPTASSLASLLQQRKETVAVAESSTGGLISAALLAVPGASAYFLGGGVIYTQAARRGLLQVADQALQGLRPATHASPSPAPSNARSPWRRGTGTGR